MTKPVCIISTKVTVMADNICDCVSNFWLLLGYCDSVAMVVAVTVTVTENLTLLRL